VHYRRPRCCSVLSNTVEQTEIISKQSFPVGLNSDSSPEQATYTRIISYHVLLVIKPSDFTTTEIETTRRRVISFVVLPPSTYLFTVGVEVVYLHLITLRHTRQSVGLLWTRDRPVAETST
jgi:hypothetical protein